MDTYCVRCKRKTPMISAKTELLKNGRPVLRGVCPDCGMNKIMFIRSK